MRSNDENFCPQRKMTLAARPRKSSARRKSKVGAELRTKKQHHHEQRLEAALLGAKTLNNPVHLEVFNVSQWFQVRKVLRGKQSAHIVKRDDSGKKFAASIFDVKSDSRVGSFKPIKRAVGVYPTVTQAHQACEEACVARDKRGTKCSKNADVPATHFVVRIVHLCFEKMSHTERVEVVYEALLDSFFVENHTSAEFKDCTVKGFSYIGARVSNLGQFRHIGNMPFELMLDLRVPSQHVCSDIESTEQIALQDVLSGEGKHKSSQKGVFAHFFFGLDPSSRSLLIDEYKKNVRLANGDNDILHRGTFLSSQVQSGQGKDGDEVPAAASSGATALDKEAHNPQHGDSRNLPFKMSDPLGGALAEKVAHAFTGVEEEVSTKCQISARTMTASAIRLQRIRRRGYLPRMQRMWARKQRAAVLIQCLCRGVRGRLYAAHWRAIRDESLLKIQCIRRGIMGRRAAREKERVATSLALLVQPVCRGRIARGYSTWLREHWQSAASMQRVVRGFLGRCRARDAQVVRFRLLLVEASIRIQSMVRGHLGRKRANKVLSAVLQHYVLVPCSIVIQSYWRLIIARKEYLNRKRLTDAASQIQKCVRGVRVRSMFRTSLFTVYQHRCASVIQAFFRGWIHRNLMRALSRKEWHYARAVPSVILIQARYRGHVQSSRLKLRKDRWASAMKIQLVYRAAMTREATKSRWRGYVVKLHFVSARSIQRLYRGWRARMLTAQRKKRETARKIAASHLIIRAWKQYKHGKVFLAYRNAWTMQQSESVLVALRDEQTEILEDLNDIHADKKENDEFIAWASERITTLRKYLGTSTERHSVVAKELEELSAKQEGGREELSMRELKDEQEWLRNQADITREESRLCKAEITTSEHEMDQLHHEMDQLHHDLEEVCTLEFEEHRIVRQRELTSQIRSCKKEWETCVKEERQRWRVKLPRKLQ